MAKLHNGVTRLIKLLGQPKLTEAEKEIIKDYHNYHGDRRISVVGRLPYNGVLVRIVDCRGRRFSVIDDLSDDYCTEFEFRRRATNDDEVDMIRDWLKDDLDLLSDRTINSVPDECFNVVLDETIALSGFLRKEGLIEQSRQTRIRYEDFYEDQADDEGVSRYGDI